MAKDRARLLRDLEQRIISGDGALDSSIRRAAAGEDQLTGPAAALIDKVRRHAYRVVDDDIAALRASGTSEDQVFELTVAAALGEGMRRIRIVQQLLAQEEVENNAP
jgi:alkylhydroperoxidase family enzyme